MSNSDEHRSKLQFDGSRSIQTTAMDADLLECRSCMRTKWNIKTGARLDDRVDYRAFNVTTRPRARRSCHPNRWVARAQPSTYRFCTARFRYSF